MLGRQLAGMVGFWSWPGRDKCFELGGGRKKTGFGQGLWLALDITA
jgi:hypothetical protein